MSEPTDLERAEQLYDFLTGESIPENILAKSPKLSKKKAFTIIWFLQEITGVLPDNIEQCCRCKSLYDTWSSGHVIDDGNYKELGFKKSDIDKNICDCIW